MAIYKVLADQLSPLAETTFAKEAVKERDDLQRLLKKKIEIISPDTLVISEEFGDWHDSKRRIDLLGIDKDANIVVIELKRTEDGGHMDLQAIRYAAMVSAMTFEQAEKIFEKYLVENGNDANARSALTSFLEWDVDDVNEDDFAQEVKIVLASAEFSKEITTSVIWLNNQGLDIRCVRLKPYSNTNELLLDVQQVIPLPEAEEYQIKLRNKQRKEKQARASSRDRSKYTISYNGVIEFEGFIKADIALNTVRTLEKNNLIDNEVFLFLRADRTSNFDLLKTPDQMTDTERKYSKFRFKEAPEFVYDSVGYYVVRNWGIGNTPKFIEKMTKEFASLKYSIE
jgi:hypothetical protein